MASYWPILLACLYCASAKEKNVLFITVDDLRPQFDTYLGKEYSPFSVYPDMITPNLDALASESLVLERAYSQISTCAPSRTSFLTGRRPDTLRVWESKKYWRTFTGNFTTLPQYFKEHGYYTTGCGKVFHGGSRSSNSDDPISWSAPYYQPPNNKDTHFYYNFGWEHITYAVDQALIDEEGELPDQQTANHAVETIDKTLGSVGKPFFMAVGFHRPHLPFVVPEKYFDMYPEDEIKLPAYPYAPQNMPDIAWSNYLKDEMKRYVELEHYSLTGDVNNTMPDDLTKRLRRGYSSSLTKASVCTKPWLTLV